MNEVDEDAWTTWLAYRKAIRKALKEVSWPAARKRLASFGENQAAVVEQSIANGWQGLFALKDGHGTGRSTARDRHGEQHERLRRWAESG